MLKNNWKYWSLLILGCLALVYWNNQNGTTLSIKEQKASTSNIALLNNTQVHRQSPPTQQFVNDEKGREKVSTKNISSLEKETISKTYSKSSLKFESNQRQTDSNAKFLAREQGYNLFLGANNFTLALNKPFNQKLPTPNSLIDNLDLKSNKAIEMGLFMLLVARCQMIFLPNKLLVVQNLQK
ncbi:MAG: hypothetical protein HY819_02845 [Acidobacteria bacterium]|nr:hypothetical protein [Acidobacteriota bacterium]